MKSIEDHGYILNLGVPDVSGFLSFKDAKQSGEERFHIGQILDVTVSNFSANGRSCNVLYDHESFVASAVRPIFPLELHSLTLRSCQK